MAGSHLLLAVGFCSSPEWGADSLGGDRVFPPRLRCLLRELLHGSTYWGVSGWVTAGVLVWDRPPVLASLHPSPTALPGQHLRAFAPVTRL